MSPKSNNAATSQNTNLICLCHGVPEEEIRQAIREGAKSIAEIQAKTLASTGCGGCGSEIERILEEEQKKQPQKS